MAKDGWERQVTTSHRLPHRGRGRQPRGPLTIGHLFDAIGRRKMIAGRYVLSGLLPAIAAFPFNAGVLNAVTQTIAWCIFSTSHRQARALPT